MEKADFGLVGLAVMGQNLVLNMDDHGFRVAVFNRTVATVDEFVNGNARDTKVIGTHSIEELVEVLERPRRVMLLVKAGQPVDDFIELLLPQLEAGDIIIDGGNSNYHDTMRRTAYVESKGLLYIGTGGRGRVTGHRSCPVARRRRGHTSNRSSRQSRPRSRTARRVATGSEKTAPDTS
jgi:6-phosphogluconate dehydrogenase